MNNNNILDSIRNNSKYACKGEIIFKTSMMYIIDYGKEKLSDKDMMSEWFKQIDRKHNESEKENKILFIGREFEKALLECAIEIANVETVDIIKYIQRNWLYYDYNEINYQRAIELLKDVVNNKLINYYGTDAPLDDLKYNIGFSEDELDALGFAEILNLDDEENE